MIFALVIIIITCTLLWDYLLRKKRNDFLKKYNIKGPTSWPLIGNAFQLRNVNAENAFCDTLAALQQCPNKQFRFWMLHQLVIVNANPKELEPLLSSPIHITKSMLAAVVEPWMATGVFTSDGAKWHYRRKLLTPTMHFKILENFVETFDRASTMLVEEWKCKADGLTAFDVVPSLGRIGLDVLLETSFGVPINTLKDKDANSRYIKASVITSDTVANRLRIPTWTVDWLFRVMAPLVHHNMHKSMDIMKQFAQELIEKRSLELRQLNRHNIPNKPHDDVDDCKPRLPLLDLLLQATNAQGQALSNTDILEEIETFLFAGTDTSKTSISFALYLISRHPQVQQKLFEEICSVLGRDKTKPIRWTDLQNMRYLDCVVKETLRLFPSVPVIGRYFKHQTELNGKIIPSNTHLSIPIFAIHRDPEYFDKPNEFIPERFLDMSVYPFAYIPFSAGPRNCIGMRFILTQMKSTVSKVLRHYELMPLGPEVVPSLSMIFRSKTGAHLGLMPRIYA